MKQSKQQANARSAATSGADCYYASKNGGGRLAGKKFSVDEPCQTIMAAGMAGDSIGHWHLYFNQNASSLKMQQVNKPEYRVPLVSEINAMPRNGYKVASTFSGTGGSCLGYRMAGFDVVWANEFVPIAQESYKANAVETCALDGRDIRQVTAADVFRATGLTEGELDIFDGSPPCQAFSTAGKRHKGWGKLKKYEHGAKQCNEQLFWEYIRLLNELKPKIFIAENVSGLLKGTAKGMFLEIMRDLKATGYNVKCKLLDAQWLGVPQRRQRAIFFGVRNDLNAEPIFPKPLSYQYTVRDALPWITKLAVLTFNGDNEEITNKPCVTIACTAQRSGFNRKETELIDTDISRYAIGKEWDNLAPGEQSKKYFNCIKTHPDKVSEKIMASSGHFPSAAQPLHPFERRKFTIEEVKRLCSFPDDFILTGSYAQQWERLGRAVPPVMMMHIAKTIQLEILEKL